MSEITAAAETADFEPALRARDVYPEVKIDALTATLIAILGFGLGLGTLARADVTPWAATIALEFMPILASSEETLRFGWESRCC